MFLLQRCCLLHFRPVLDYRWSDYLSTRHSFLINLLILS